MDGTHSRHNFRYRQISEDNIEVKCRETDPSEVTHDKGHWGGGCHDSVELLSSKTGKCLD
jgi:hypothetical protein